jgi:hypothetical protein
MEKSKTIFKKDNKNKTKPRKVKHGPPLSSTKNTFLLKKDMLYESPPRSPG